MSDGVWRIEAETIPVAFADGPEVQIDPFEAYGMICDLQEEHGVGNLKIPKALRAWLAERLGIEEKRIDLGAVITFSATIIEIAEGFVEARKKKVSETASSLLAILESLPTSGNGQTSTKTSGLRTFPNVKPTRTGSKQNIGTTRSTASKRRKKKSPATQNTQSA